MDASNQNYLNATHHHAALNGQESTLRFLKDECNQDMNKLTCNGMSPVHYAAQGNHIGCVDFLAGKCCCDQVN
jgi:hypothetical protein